MTAYRPKGAVVLLLAAMRKQPEREFTAAECADIMGCVPRAVGAMTEYSTRFGLISRRKDGRQVLFRAMAYTEDELEDKRRAKLRTPVDPLKSKGKPPGPWVPDQDDPRITRVVPGWKPPVMRCVRAGE
jgi:hypothetical protein